jgi:predicted transcriptional regulator
MTTLSLRLPESIHRKLAEIAEREGISMNQFISSAVAEKISALMTEEYLETRASRGSEEAFWRVMSKVPSGTPAAGDELPADLRRPRKNRKQTD